MRQNKRFVKALLATSALATAVPVLAQENSEVDEFDEILVTATRRAQSVQDVPYNISAVSGQDMENLGITDLGKLADFVPGLNYIDFGARGNLVSSSINIRGLNAEATNNVTGALSTVAPVSIYLDETPIFANLRLVDIERVEVLRGPQGTLYGSGSVGGTVRYIQNKPDLDAFEAKISGDVGKTKGAGSADYSVDGVINIPVGDTLAIRASACYDRSAGYIDYTNLYVLDGNRAPALADPSDVIGSSAQKYTLKNANKDVTWNARVAAYWEPTENLNILATYHHQKDTSDALASTTADHNAAGRDANSSFHQSPFEAETDLFSLDIELDLGFASLVSSTSKSKVVSSGQTDATGQYLNFGFYEGTYGVWPRDFVLTDSGLEDESFVQEVRLVSQHEGPIQYVVGAFHRKQDYAGTFHDFVPGHADFFNACAADVGFDPLDPTYDPFSGLFPDAAFDCGTGAPFGVPGLATVAGLPTLKDQVYVNDFTQDFKDTAIFGEVSYQITDGWQVTGGFRAFWQNFKNNQQLGAFYTARTLLSLALDPELAIRDIDVSNKSSDVIFKLNTSFDLADDHKVYATWSQGFRRGGANGLPPVIFSFDSFEVEPVNSALFEYGRDKVTNHELGFKGRIERMNYNVAFFLDNWNDFQINESVTSNALGAVVNGGTSQSKGVEIAFDGDLTDNLSVMLSYTYTDSKVTHYSPLLVQEVLFGDDPGDNAGVQMPGTPKHSASWAAMYSVPMGDTAELSFDFTGSYKGPVNTSIYPGSARDIKGYAFVNVGASYVEETWSMRLSVDNLFNESGISSADGVRTNSEVANSLANFYGARPRSVRLGMSYRFGG